ncbi:hypothetical protein RSAG8_13586, partial [Rhizoctonia solani AG-8 WAC10335]
MSVAVSFTAMLSKEWFFGFMRGRTGSPAAQARRRQLRWEKFQQWKMEEVLAALPVVIHISLLPFSGGLCVFLWELDSPAVAIPVTTVVVLMVSTCTFFTIVGPMLDNYCPYSTSTFRLYNAFRRKDPKAIPDEPSQDSVTTKVLQSMLNSENPHFVDLAVQSLSAAKFTGISVKLLEEFNTWSLIWSRFQALQPYNIQSDYTIVSLYSRAFLALEELNYDGEDRSKITPEKFCLLLWATQGYARQRDRHHTSRADIRQEALHLGRAAVYHCLIALRHNPQPQDGPGDDYPENSGLAEVTSFFERANTSGCKDVYGDICLGFTTLLCCSPPNCPPSTLFPFIRRFMLPQPHDSKFAPEFALALGAYAFSRFDYPYYSPESGTNSFAQPQSHISRVERALSIVWHYVSGKEDYPEELAALGLRYLEARLTGENREEVSLALNPYLPPIGQPRAATKIHTLPPDFDIRL